MSLTPHAPAATVVGRVVRTPPLIVLALLHAVAPLATDMYLAGLPEMAEDLAVPVAATQLTLTAFLVGMAVGQLVIGPLSDQVGRRRPLLLGTSLCLVASVACVLAPTVEVLVAARFVQGFGGAAGIVLARAVITDTTEGSATARATGLMMMVGSVAPVVAPLLGGAVLPLGGWRAPLVVLALLTAVMLVAALATVPESHPPAARGTGGARALARGTRAVLGRRRYVGHLLTFVAGFGALFSYIAASPFVLTEVLGLSTAESGAAFGAIAAGVVAGGVLSLRLVGRVSPARLLLVGVGLLLGAAVGVAVALGAGAPVGVVLALIWCSLASLGLVFGNAAVLAAEEVRDLAGTGSALLGSLQFAAGALVSPLVGLAGEDAAWPMATGMVVCAGVAALGQVLARTGRVRGGS